MPARWPYDVEVPERPSVGLPRWECPGGTCVCHDGADETDVIPHRIALFDDGARRMTGARCRVWSDGRLLNHGEPHADRNGAVEIQVGASTQSLLVEWAPADTPIRRDLPYRVTYLLGDQGEGLRERVARRLHNVGFCVGDDLEQQVRGFQRVYGLPGVQPSGRPEDVDVQLAGYHDLATLPPIATPHEPHPSAGGVGGSAREALFDLPFEVGVEVGEHVPWAEDEDLVIVDLSGEEVFRAALSTGAAEPGLRVMRFEDFRKNERYTVKVRFDDLAYVLYEWLDIYDLVSPATVSAPPVPPARAFVEEDD